MQDTPDPCHAPPKPVALVLGAAVWPGGVASPSLDRRSRHAAQLWLDGRVSDIIACGGLGLHPPSEAEVIAALCRDMGVPEQALHLEDASTTTDENIRFAVPILEGLGRRQVVVVTDAYHAPRARMVARGLGLQATSSSPGLSGTHPLRLARILLREIPALALYGLRRLRARFSGSRSR